MRSLLKLLMAILAILATTAPLPARGGSIAGNDTIGTTDYPNHGIRQVGSFAAEHAESSPLFALIDSDHGFSYFVTDNNSGGDRVVKVALARNGIPARRIGSIPLEEGEESIWCGGIDPVHGYAYFCTSATQKVIKVALGEGDELPKRIGSVSLDAGDLAPTTAVLDAANGYMYVATSKAPGRIVKLSLGQGDTLPSRVGALTWTSESYRFEGGAIDTKNGYAYFNEISSNSLLKVSLGAGNNLPQVVGALEFESDEEIDGVVLCDSTNGYGYLPIVLATNLYGIAKVSLGDGDSPPIRIGFAVEPDPVGGYASGVIDLKSGHALFGTWLSPTIVKYQLGDDDLPPTFVGKLDLGFYFHDLTSGVLDPANATAYFVNHHMASETYHDSVFQIHMGAAGEPPYLVDTILFPPDYSNLYCALFDQTRQLVYLGTDSITGLLAKFAAGTGNQFPIHHGTLILDEFMGHPDVMIKTGVIDPASGNGYFWDNGTLLECESGPEGAAPTIVSDEVIFVQDEGNPFSNTSVIDEMRGFAFFAVGASPTRIAKVSLRRDDHEPALIGSTELSENENYSYCSVIDASKGFAYFGIHGSPGRVVKVALGEGTNPPQRVGAVTLEAGENSLRSAVLDELRSYAYFITNTNPAQVIKIDLGEGTAPPTRLGSITLNPGDFYVGAAAIDPVNRCAYLGSYDPNPNTIDRMQIVKIDLGEGDALPTRLFSVPLQSIDYAMRVGMIDLANGYTYFATGGRYGGLIKVGYTQRDSLRATRFDMTEAGIVTAMRFHSHAADGNIRLAIYDDAEPKQIVWQSNSVPNIGGEVAVAIGAGTPRFLYLTPGTYWLAWQTDSTADIGSYTPGVESDGFMFDQAFGPSPASLSGSQITLTSERWTQYITYDQDPLLAMILGAEPATAVGDHNADGVIDGADAVN